VNGRGQHIRTPKDIKIYSMPKELAAHAQVPPLEQSERAEATLPAPAHSFPHSPFIIDQNNDVPKWQTYIVQEDIALRIRLSSHEDRILVIPTRTPSGTTSAVLQP